MAFVASTAVHAGAVRLPATACPSATYAVATADLGHLAQIVGPQVTRVALGAQVTLGECAATATLKPKRAFTLVKARWPVCAAAHQVRLVAKIASPACDTARVVLRARRTPPFALTLARVNVPVTTTTMRAGTTTTTTTTLPHRALCGNRILEAGELCDGDEGCGRGEQCTAACTCELAPAPTTPPALALIKQALDDGRIDLFTSLLYRAYAFTFDERLPEEFDGDFSIAEDITWWFDVARSWDGLTADQQQALLPYTVRPTDPRSVYSAPPASGTLVAPVSATRRDAAPAAPQPIQCPQDAATNQADWRYSETTHFVIWSCGGGDPTSVVDDPYESQRITAGELAEQVWDLEEPVLGPPKEDDLHAGPDPQKRVDVYLLQNGGCKRRHGNCWPIAGRALAQAAVDSPCDRERGPLTSSGYLMHPVAAVPSVAPDAGTPSRFRSDLAHEFFHLLSYGLNLEAQGGTCRTSNQPTNPRGSWLTEASAQWAEWAFVPKDDTTSRANWFSNFQKRTPDVESLIETTRGGNDKSYGAYVYPLFLAQDGGGKPDVFETFWFEGTLTPRTPAQLDDALDAQVSFQTKFRDFAVRMLDTNKLPGDPISPLLNAIDPAATPNLPPMSQPEWSFAEAPTDFEVRLGLAPVSAEYRLIHVSDPVRWMDIDFTPMGDGGKIDVDVIADVHGTWERRKIDNLRFTFCRDKPKDDISEFFLIISNFMHHVDDKASGNYQIKLRTVCPEQTLEGYIRSELTHKRHAAPLGEVIDAEDRHTETWTFGNTTTVSVGPLDFPGVEVNWSSRYSSHSTGQMSLTGPCPQGWSPVFTEDDASGSRSGHTDTLAVYPLPGGALGLSLASGSAGPGLGSYDVQQTRFAASCNGLTQETYGTFTVTDQLGIVLTSTQGVAMMAPDQDNPNHFAGATTLLHQTQPTDGGGEEVVDWQVSWDVTRHD